MPTERRAFDRMFFMAPHRDGDSGPGGGQRKGRKKHPDARLSDEHYERLGKEAASLEEKLRKESEHPPQSALPPQNQTPGYHTVDLTTHDGEITSLIRVAGAGIDASPEPPSSEPDYVGQWHRRGPGASHRRPSGKHHYGSKSRDI